MGRTEDALTGRDTSIDWNDRLADEGRWQQMRGRIRQTWGSVTDDDLDGVEGSWDRLIGTIKERTGEAADLIERRLQEMLR
jgi:uncharacterized protein YjbJ (UPF0337 family)